MKTVRKTLILLIFILLCACSGRPSPTKVIEGELKELRDKCMNEFSSSLTDQDRSEAEMAVFDQFGKMIAAQECKLDNEQINGDKATVDAHFKTYDFGTSFMDTLTEYVSQGMSLAMSGASEEELGGLVYKVWLEDLLELEKGGVTKDFDFTFELDKTDEGWIISNADSAEFLDGMFGGLFSTMSSLGG